jgi:hypothetical protein
MLFCYWISADSGSLITAEAGAITVDVEVAKKAVALIVL